MVKAFRELHKNTVSPSEDKQVLVDTTEFRIHQKKTPVLMKSYRLRRTETGGHGGPPLQLLLSGHNPIKVLIR
jgi:hypothetical protein